MGNKVESQAVSKNLILVAVCVLLMGLDGLGVFAGVKRVIERQMVRVQEWGSVVTKVVSTPVSLVGFYRSGLARLAEMEQRLAENAVVQVEVDELREENKMLRRMLEIGNVAEWEMYPVKVVGQSSQLLVVVGGRNLGLSEGMSVVDGEVLVGVVSKVSEAVSWVRLLGDQQVQVAALVVGKSTRGVVVNDGVGDLVLDQVLQGDRLAMGDVVISAGTDGLMPNLIIGTVGEIEGEASSVYKRAKLRRLSGAEGYDVVMVIRAGDGRGR